MNNLFYNLRFLVNNIEYYYVRIMLICLQMWRDKIFLNMDTRQDTGGATRVLNNNNNRFYNGTGRRINYFIAYKQ